MKTPAPALSPGLPLADSTTPNTNDVRRFVYRWFTLWEHRSAPERLVPHLAGESLNFTFPGGEPLRSAEEFIAWYEALLANTMWNFHELRNITVVATPTDGCPAFHIGFDVSWQGQLVPGSEWQSNISNARFRFEVHQDWRVVTHDGDAVDDPFEIVTLVATIL